MSIRAQLPKTKHEDVEQLALVQAHVSKELRDKVVQQMKLDRLMNIEVTWKSLITLMLHAYLKESEDE